jgi:hypothetical protein
MQNERKMEMSKGTSWQRRIAVRLNWHSRTPEETCIIWTTNTGGKELAQRFTGNTLMSPTWNKFLAPTANPIKRRLVPPNR